MNMKIVIHNRDDSISREQNNHCCGKRTLNINMYNSIPFDNLKITLFDFVSFLDPFNPANIAMFFFFFKVVKLKVAYCFQ